MCFLYVCADFCCLFGFGVIRYFWMIAHMTLCFTKYNYYLQVLINSANMGASTMAGPGAGRFPTANSVVNDLVRLAQGRAVPAFPLDCESAFAIDNNYESRFYIRIKCSDELGIIRQINFFCLCSLLWVKKGYA